MAKHDKDDHERQTAHAARGNGYNFIVVFFAALGSFTYGYCSSIIGAVFGLPAFFTYFNISLTGPNAAKGNDFIGGKAAVPSQAYRADQLDSGQWLVRWWWYHWRLAHLACS